jgi:hypothetical protein
VKFFADSSSVHNNSRKGVLEMNNIEVAGYTQAMKARGILRQNGIMCDIKKTTSQSGCSFTVAVQDNSDQARQILLQNGIRIIR